MKIISTTKFKSSLKENINELAKPAMKFHFPVSHGISVYPPNILPISDFTIIRVAPLLSQFLWNVPALNPSLDPRWIRLKF